MSEIAQAVYAWLDERGIAYQAFEHAPAYHMEDCAEVGKEFGAAHCKNYFLTTKSRKVYALCIVRPNARLRTADVSKQAGTPRLSFAGEEDMEALLHTRPGAVSPMGLIFDPECRVRLLVDGALREEEKLAFHPCDNAKTVILSAEDFFEKFLPGVGHEPTFVEIHDFA